MIPCTAFLTLGMNSAKAQVGSGTIYVASEAGTVADYDFSGPTGGTPTVITNRTNPATSVFSFDGTAKGINVAAPNQFIDGYARSYQSGDFIFPIGSGGIYAPVKASGASASTPVDAAYYAASPNSGSVADLYNGGTVTAPGGPFSTGSIDPALAAVSGSSFWDINGTAPVTISLSWDASHGISDMVTSANQLDSLTLVGWNGTQWVKIPSVIDNAANSVYGTTSDITQGSITTQSPVVPNIFLAFAIGKISDFVPLAVTGMELSSHIAGNTVVLNWFTRTEHNSDHFIIERSADGSRFEKIGSAKAAGNAQARMDYAFTDKNPLSGLNYYRIVQVDIDGKSVLSGIVSEQFSNSNTIVVFPNPASDILHVSGLTGHEQLQLFNVTGQMLKTITMQGSNKATIDLRDLVPGMYTLSLTDGTTRRVFKVSKL